MFVFFTIKTNFLYFQTILRGMGTLHAGTPRLTTLTDLIGGILGSDRFDTEQQKWFTCEPEDVGVFFATPKDDVPYNFRTWLTPHQTKRGFSEIAVVVDYAPLDYVVPADEVYRLAQEFGGGQYIRLMLQQQRSQQSSDSPREILFDFDIFKGELGAMGLMGRFPEMKLYHQRGVLERVLPLLGIAYEVHGLSLSIAKVQPTLQLTPETLRDAYQLLHDTGYLPSIGNSSERSSFHVFHHPRYDGHVSRLLHLSLMEPYDLRNDTSREVVDLSRLRAVDSALQRNGCHVYVN